MVKYLFKCKECNIVEEKNMTFEEYIEKKDSTTCGKCQSIMKRTFKSFSFRVDKSSQEMAEDLVLEKEKLKEKINAGDIKTISDIFGSE